MSEMPKMSRQKPDIPIWVRLGAGYLVIAAIFYMSTAVYAYMSVDISGYDVFLVVVAVSIAGINVLAAFEILWMTRRGINLVQAGTVLGIIYSVLNFARLITPYPGMPTWFKVTDLIALIDLILLVVNVVVLYWFSKNERLFLADADPPNYVKRVKAHEPEWEPPTRSATAVSPDTVKRPMPVRASPPVARTPRGDQPPRNAQIGVRIYAALLLGGSILNAGLLLGVSLAPEYRAGLQDPVFLLYLFAVFVVLGVRAVAAFYAWKMTPLGRDLVMIGAVLDIALYILGGLLFGFETSGLRSVVIDVIVFFWFGANAHLFRDWPDPKAAPDSATTPPVE